VSLCSRSARSRTILRGLPPSQVELAEAVALKHWPSGSPYDATVVAVPGREQLYASVIHTFMGH
jgi:hypothetical protein